MRIKLLILSLLIWCGSFGQSVPNTATFTLQDVTNVVTGIGSDDLVECFAHAVDGYFDATYKGSKNSLYNFRNYTIPGASLSTVTTTTITAITTTTATGGGNVTSDGGGTVTARGVCWNTLTNPTVYNYKTTDGSGTGSFTSSLTGLDYATTYYVRAYATNSAGTAYGSEVTFTTDACQRPGGLYTFALNYVVAGVTITSANVCYYKDNYSTPASSHDAQWSLVDGDPVYSYPGTDCNKITDGYYVLDFLNGAPKIGVHVVGGLGYNYCP